MIYDIMIYFICMFLPLQGVVVLGQSDVFPHRQMLNCNVLNLFSVSEIDSTIDGTYLYYTHILHILKK